MNDTTVLDRPGIAGRVLSGGEAVPLCTGDDGCLPPPDELTRLAAKARTGPVQPFVGAGHPDTLLACVHGTWRLGDQIVPLSRACMQFAHDACRDMGCRCSHHETAGYATGPVDLAAAAEGSGVAELIRQNADLQRRLATLEARSQGICTGTTKAGAPCSANVIPGTDRCIAHPRGN